MVIRTASGRVLAPRTPPCERVLDRAPPILPNHPNKQGRLCAFISDPLSVDSRNRPATDLRGPFPFSCPRRDGGWCGRRAGDRFHRGVHEEGRAGHHDALGVRVDARKQVRRDGDVDLLRWAEEPFDWNIDDDPHPAGEVGIALARGDRLRRGDRLAFLGQRLAMKPDRRPVRTRVGTQPDR